MGKAGHAWKHSEPARGRPGSNPKRGDRFPFGILRKLNGNVRLEIKPKKPSGVRVETYPGCWTRGRGIFPGIPVPILDGGLMVGWQNKAPNTVEPL